MLLQKVEMLAIQIKAVVEEGQEFPEGELHQLFELHDVVKISAHSGMTLVLVYSMLREFAAAADLLRLLIEEHGALPALLYHLALMEEKNGKLEDACDLLQQLIGAGFKDYSIYLACAAWKEKMGDARGAIAMANLAVYENREEDVTPFAIMARCFHALEENNRMFECFARVEKFKGEAFLAEAFGALYIENEDIYKGLKGAMEQGNV